ncbi:hypothetical protein CPB83DRAFT_899272 [Crepidotus variabilis]|uniref:FCP1 homology domain-containing protein n=1 Tax=Crepidotus variabilis TaxID=179855 RepID=A0A9P6JJI8_9AGAR|nr:hypothetical protein CPB83DRAFT_899272 [Crepidotus variabilis]
MSPSRGTGKRSHFSQQSSRKRRRSPIYDDYREPGQSEPHASDEQTYLSYRRKSSPSHEKHGSIDSRSRYTNEREKHVRRSASPKFNHDDEASSSSRSSPKPFLFAGAHLETLPQISRSTSPQQTQRAEPSDEYLQTTLEQASCLDDPAKSRKLVVLDLNGSLLLRSAHQRRTGYSDPYSDPTRLRPLRTVHRRPYLTAFTSYLLHDETKKWLDTMIWSSAQPHSVEDMADKCFGKRKEELRAIWARDTLGLTQDQYHKKSITLKDLEKPWFKLVSPDDASAQPIYSARTTILVDDSPLKAALQPWNHLCIKEYLPETRKWDLGVADWEVAQERAKQAREALELEKQRKLKEAEDTEREKKAQEEQVQAVLDDPNVTKVIREVVMVNGKMVGEEQVVKKVTREVAMVDGVMASEQDGFVESVPSLDGEKEESTTKKKRKLKHLAKKEAVLKAKEEVEKEALLAQLAALQESNVEEGEISIGDLVNEETQLASLKDKMKYDETLLAVVGIIEHLKHENNLAAWLRSGGILRKPSQNAEEESSVKSRSESPVTASPTKKRRIGSSPPTSPPPSSQALGTADPADHDSSLEGQALTGVPLVSPDTVMNDQKSSSLHHTLWFERPAVLAYWADRGRTALQELGIQADHGILPSSG